MLAVGEVSNIAEIVGIYLELNENVPISQLLFLNLPQNSFILAPKVMLLLLKSAPKVTLRAKPPIDVKE